MLPASEVSPRPVADVSSVIVIAVAVAEIADIKSDDARTPASLALVGCESCNRGYKARTGIYEVVQITPKIARMILEGANSMEIADEARKEGFPSLRTSALMKVAKGMISLEEANRVTVD